MVTETVATAARLPVQRATYPGDSTAILTQGAKGPNTLDELLWPVTATYDPQTNTTRVGFSYLAPPDLTPEELFAAQARVASARQSRRAGGVV